MPGHVRVKERWAKSDVKARIYFCKAERLLMHKALCVLTRRSNRCLLRRYNASLPGSKGDPPPRYSLKIKNEPEKCFRINKSCENEPENEPERTRADASAGRLSYSKSTDAVGFREDETRNEPENEPRMDGSCGSRSHDHQNCVDSGRAPE
jgi:hypothetical protein